MLGFVHSLCWPRKLTFTLFFTFQLMAEFRGEARFLRRLGPGGLGTGSLKLKSVQKSINTVDLALMAKKRTSSLRENRPTSMVELNKGVIDLAVTTIKKTQHGVTMAAVPESMKTNLEVSTDNTITSPS